MKSIYQNLCPTDVPLIKYSSGLYKSLIDTLQRGSYQELCSTLQLFSSYFFSSENALQRYTVPNFVIQSIAKGQSTYYSNSLNWVSQASQIIAFFTTPSRLAGALNLNPYFFPCFVSLIVYQFQNLLLFRFCINYSLKLVQQQVK